VIVVVDIFPMQRHWDGHMSTLVCRSALILISQELFAPPSSLHSADSFQVAHTRCPCDILGINSAVVGNKKPAPSFPRESSQNVDWDISDGLCVDPDQVSTSYGIAMLLMLLAYFPLCFLIFVVHIAIVMVVILIIVVVVVVVVGSERSYCYCCSCCFCTCTCFVLVVVVVNNNYYFCCAYFW